MPLDMSSGCSSPHNFDVMSVHETESGYVSGSGSESSLPEIYFTKPHLAFLNRQLQFLEPQGMFIPYYRSSRKLLIVVLRDLTMVHYVPSRTFPNHGIWSHGLGHVGHVVKDEDPPTATGGPDLP